MERLMDVYLDMFTYQKGKKQGLIKPGFVYRRK